MTGWRSLRHSSSSFRFLTVGFLLLWTAAASWRCSGPPKVDVNAELQKLKIPTIPKKLNAEQVAMVQKAWDGPAQFFVRRGCIACHSISLHNIKGLTTIGPDLTIAVEDVKTRFGRTVEDFLDKPQGTMQMVLGTLINLSPEDKANAIKQLHGFYDEHQKKKASPGN